MFLSFIMPICMKCSLVIPNFFEKIFSLSHSIVFLYFFALFVHLRRLSFLSLLFSRTLHSVGCYLSLSPLFFASLLSSAICKASSDNHSAFLHFFFLGMLLVTASCYEPPSIVLQALCLSDLFP